MDEIEGQFLAFVLPWLKLVPKTTENDVPSYKVRVGGGHVTFWNGFFFRLIHSGLKSEKSENRSTNKNTMIFACL